MPNVLVWLYTPAYSCYGYIMETLACIIVIKHSLQSFRKVKIFQICMFKISQIGLMLSFMTSLCLFWKHFLCFWCSDQKQAAKSSSRMLVPFPFCFRWLYHFHIVGRVKPLPAIVLLAPTPALVILILDLQKLLTCREDESFYSSTFWAAYSTWFETNECWAFSTVIKNFKPTDGKMLT